MIICIKQLHLSIWIQITVTVHVQEYVSQVYKNAGQTKIQKKSYTNNTQNAHKLYKYWCCSFKHNSLVVT